MNIALFILGLCIAFLFGYMVGLIHGLISSKSEGDKIKEEMNGNIYNGRSMFSSNQNDSNYKEFDHE